MIERILVMCPTRTESLRWVEILRQQIKCARTPPSVSSSNVVTGVAPNHPLPPPHVSSNSPPFIMLTLWIRDAIEDGRLTLNDIKDLTKQNDNPDQKYRQTLSPWRLRKYRNQVFFNNDEETEVDYDDLTENYKRDALIDEDDNPFGYIRYISSGSDEITLLLPSPEVSEGSSEGYEPLTLSYSHESGMDSNDDAKGTRKIFLDRYLCLRQAHLVKVALSRKDFRFWHEKFSYSILATEFLPWSRSFF